MEEKGKKTREGKSKNQQRKKKIQSKNFIRIENKKNLMMLSVLYIIFLIFCSLFHFPPSKTAKWLIVLLRAYIKILCVDFLIAFFFSCVHIAGKILLVTCINEILY